MAKFFLVNFFVKLNFGLLLRIKVFYKVSVVEYFFKDRCKIFLIIIKVSILGFFFNFFSKKETI